MPYKITDKVIAYLIKQYIKLFRRAKGLVSFDELNVIDLSHEIYDTALTITQDEMVRLTDAVYKRYRTKKPEETEVTSPGLPFVLALMAAYNPVTKYRYDHEVDRKRSRFVESLIASDRKGEEIDRSLRLWVAMNKQLADDVTFDTMVQAFADSGVKHVEWVTHPDDRRCEVCRGRHGKVYRIDSVPAKPHMNCRCYLKPAEKERKK